MRDDVKSARDARDFAPDRALASAGARSVRNVVPSRIHEVLPVVEHTTRVRQPCGIERRLRSDVPMRVLEAVR